MNGNGELSADWRGDSGEREHRLRRLRQLDRLLWVCWVGLPVSIGMAYRKMLDFHSTIMAGAVPEAADCLRFMAHPDSMSPLGKALVWLLAVFAFSIYFVILWVLHRMVRKFSSGQIFVASTLSGLKILGIIFLFWPFLNAAVRYGIFTILQKLGDFPAQASIPVNINFAVIAMGLFLLALRIVIEHAIDMKSDHDLTI